ncbi:Dirigent protein [Thalictrum thalictroides]|uniref:Dirigent protein n=1 Tax=Thalictrum thalictroides TaxID=46969 RepID=A0A7J6WIJ5_THATH|nr:Dirigent protein [Thalictrum thalictroides]
MSSEENHQSGDLMEKKVYDIPGEPAIVIDGVPPNPNPNPNMDHHHLDPEVVVASKADSQVCPGFGNWMEGRAVRKLFGEQFYTGTVTKFDSKTGWYRVVYEDGDFEDLEWHELEEIIVPLDITVPLKTLALKTSSWVWVFVAIRWTWVQYVIDPEAVVASKADSQVCPGFGNWMEGRAVRKLFGEQFYTGTVTNFDSKTEWYRVVYEDGDFEDLEWHELEEILPLDITVPLKTLVSKTVKKQAHKGKACKD